MGSIRRTGLSAAVVVALVAFSTVAHAQSEDDRARAKAHFDAGRALYSLHNYTDAVREFAAGYQVLPLPAFLLNLGTCYRMLEDWEHARDMYREYLNKVPASDPERGDVEKMIQTLERKIKDRPAPAIAPPPVGATPTVTTTGEPAGHANVLVTAPPPRQSFLRRNWWIIPVGAVAVTGLAVGLYFGLKPADCPASLGCIDVMK